MESRFAYLPVDSNPKKNKSSSLSIPNLPSQSTHKIKKASEMKDLRERINLLLDSNVKEIGGNKRSGAQSRY